MSTTRFQKVGHKVASDLDQFPIVTDSKTQLMWDRRETSSMTHEEAVAHIVQLNKDKFGGFADWRLPECDELLTLVDRTKHEPAVDTDAFPDCKSSWYWSATSAAYSPADCAWLVYFYDGDCGWGSRSNYGFVRAVRVSQ